MRALPATVTALTALFVAFSGCADGGASEGPEGPQVREVETDDSSAAISGVVVDETIRPVEGATVRLVTTSDEVVTAEDGTFVFEGLEAGFYALEASAEQYLPIQTTVEVKAGAVAKPRIMLPVDTNPVPYHQSHQFTGYMVFSDYQGVYLLTRLIGNNELCTCMFNVTSTPGPETVVLEGVWESSTPRALDHEMYWEIWSTGSGIDGDWRTSPVLMHKSGAPYGQDTEWTVQVSSSEQPDVEQEFEGFLTFFYVEPAPADWSLVAGDR